tara:strand:+ start:1218 stop:2096 length:879 start_codon:yes stop_codon:yes gene_type:complete
MRKNISGKYKVSVKRHTGVVENYAFDNLIVDSAIANQNGIMKSIDITSISVGSGTTPASVLDTSLEAFVASKAATSVVSYSVISGGNEQNIVATSVFAVGAVVDTITEVGSSNSNGVFVSRALLGDIVGNPVSLVLGALDQLTVTYELNLRLDTFDFTTIINIKGSDKNCRLVTVNPGTTQYVNAQNFAASSVEVIQEDIGAITQDQTFNTNAFAKTVHASSYTINSNATEVSISIDMQPADVNVTFYAISFRTFIGSGVGVFLLIFDIPFTKTSADQITIDVVLTLSTGEV